MRQILGLGACALATALVVAVPAGAAPNGAWKGHLYGYGSYKKSAETGSVKFKVRKHKVVAKFKYVDANYNCIHSIFTPTDDEREYATWKFKSFRIKKGGKVHKVVKTDAAKVELKGKFKGKVAKGSIRFTSYNAGCSKSWFWKAKPTG